MRLSELISFDPKDTSTPYRKRVYKTYTPTSREIGRGHFASAIAHDSPKRVGQVKKIGQAGLPALSGSVPRLVSNVSDDAYLSYLKMVDDYNKSGKDNSYFPKIYNLKIFRKPDGTLDYNIDMEKLLKLGYEPINNNEMQMHALYKKLFKTAGTEEDDPAFDVSGHGIYIELSRIIDDGNFGLIRDAKLKEALMMIESLLKSNRKFRWDIHPGNIMWRITGNIPQLVIIDPIA